MFTPVTTPQVTHQKPIKPIIINSVYTGCYNLKRLRSNATIIVPSVHMELVLFHLKVTR